MKSFNRFLNEANDGEPEKYYVIAKKYRKVSETNLGSYPDSDTAQSKIKSLRDMSADKEDEYTEYKSVKASTYDKE